MALTRLAAATIPTGTSSSPGRPSGSKVTLTNWKRVANIPFEISADGPVQAVHWGDYVALFDAQVKEMYLYHHKCRMWSAAYTYSDDLRNMEWSSMPVAVLKTDLLLLSSTGDMYKFVVETGHTR